MVSADRSRMGRKSGRRRLWLEFAEGIAEGPKGFRYLISRQRGPVISRAQKEFALLGKTRNQAAVDCLLQLLQSPDSGIRWQAVFALTQRGEKRALEGLVAAFSDHPPIDANRWTSISHRVLPTLQGILEDPRHPLYRASLRMITHLEIVEGFGRLVQTAEQTNSPHGSFAGGALGALSVSLGRQVRSGHDSSRRETLIRHLASSLEHYSIHRSPYIPEAFLVLLEPDDAPLQAILHDEIDPRPLKVLLRQWKVTASDEVLDLLIQLVVKHHPPKSLVEVVFRERSDMKMAVALARGIGQGYLPAIIQRVEQHGLPAACQHAWTAEGGLTDEDRLNLFKIVSAGGVALHQLFRGIRQCFNAHSVEWLNAVAEIIQYYPTPSCSEILQAMAPTVMIGGEAVPASLATEQVQDSQQLREDLSFILSFRDQGEHPLLENAIRQMFRALSVETLMAHLDLLVEDALQCFADLIRLIDPHWQKALITACNSLDPSDRYHAAIAASFLGPDPTLKGALVRLVADSYKMVREEAAFALSKYPDEAKDPLPVVFGDESCMPIIAKEGV